MKNRSLVNYFRQFNPDLKVSITAYLQNGCQEKGYGRGEYENCEFTQYYSIEWNDGHLTATEYDGYTVNDVVRVLLKKTLSQITNKDFALRPGELMNGHSEYETKWSDNQPDELPDDSLLYSIMDIGDTKYEWQNASSIDFEIHLTEPDGSDSTLLSVLGEDEIDRKPDTKK